MILTIPTKTVWNWIPNMFGLKRLSKVITLKGSSVEGGCRDAIFAKLNATKEFAQLVHRYLIVLILNNINNNFPIMENRCFLSYAPYKWSREIPTWNIIDGLLDLLKPSIRRCIRSQNLRKGPFIVFEGVDGAGKTFLLDVIQELLVNVQYPVHKLVFPNGQNLYLTYGHNMFCFPYIDVFRGNGGL